VKSNGTLKGTGSSRVGQVVYSTRLRAARQIHRLGIVTDSSRNQWNDRMKIRKNWAATQDVVMAVNSIIQLVYPKRTVLMTESAV
jgi:uncharacterized protein YlbG (UPF0298 family)